ncbi:MAG: ABC transporter permease [Acidimicrobiia bacterium]
MWKVTRKGLRAHKLRFALTALAVLLGVAFMSGTFVLTDTVSKVFDDLFTELNENTDAYVRSADSTDLDFGGTVRPRIPETVVEPVRAVEGVELAEPELTLEQGIRLLDKDGEPMGNPAMGAPTLGIAWEEVTGGTGITVVDGHQPETADEIVLDKSSADEGNYEVGDEVRVTSPFGDPNQPYTLAGVVRFGIGDSPGGAITVLFTLEEIQRVSGALPPEVPEPEISGVVVSAQDGVSEQELRDRIAAALDADGIGGLEVITGEQLADETQDEIEEGIGFFTIILTVAAGIALLVGAFIIFNTFSIVVTQRTRELALLRALGASGRQVRVAVLGEAFVVGVGAAIVGVLAGIGLAVVLQAALDAVGFDLPSASLVIAPAGVAIAMTVGIVVTVISAVVPAVKASRLPPLAAIRDVAFENPRLGRRTAIGAALTVVGLFLLALGLGMVGDVDNEIYYVGFGALVVFFGVTVLSPAVARPIAGTLGWPVERLRGITGRLARANAVRNPRRSAATASALMIGVALVALIFVLADSIQTSVDAQVDRSFSVDAIVGEEGSAGFGGTISPQVTEEVVALPEVEAASGLRFQSDGDFDGKSAFYGALDTQVASQLFELDVSEGTIEDVELDDVGVSGRVAREEGWEVGDVLPTDFGVAQRDLTIRAIYELGQREGLTDFLISTSTYDTLGFPPGDQGVYVAFAPGVDDEEGIAALEAVVEPYPSLEVLDRQGLKDQIAGQINQVIAFLFVLLALAIVIAFVGIVNTLALSVLERVREIGLLRAVGMSRRQLRSSIRWEAVLVALFGTVLGLVVGLVFGWAIVRALADQGIEQFSAAPVPLVIVAIGAAFFGVLAAIFPAWRATRMNVLEAVATDE